jgi:hypothetical protein
MVFPRNNSLCVIEINLYTGSTIVKLKILLVLPCKNVDPISVLKELKFNDGRPRKV